MNDTKKWLEMNEKAKKWLEANGIEVNAERIQNLVTILSDSENKGYREGYKDCLNDGAK